MIIWVVRPMFSLLSVYIRIQLFTFSTSLLNRFIAYYLFVLLLSTYLFYCLLVRTAHFFYLINLLLIT